MSPHRPFTLLLGGGGARGFAHVGVLRALEAEGLRPSAIVGVSMGAAVAAAYVLRDDWYDAVLAIDTRAFPPPPGDGTEASLFDRLRARRLGAEFALRLVTGWGVGVPANDAGRQALATLADGRDLAEARLPVAITATDLRTGARHVMREGDAADAVYASSALAGVLPPLELGDLLLADGAYADPAPVDLARQIGPPTVLAVDVGQSRPAPSIDNGFYALQRAAFITSRSHAAARFALADLTLRPDFQRTIHTLEFDARRECAAAGAWAVRTARPMLVDLLGTRVRSTA
ncbi:patatin-like phospholipase family protein [Rubrivirga sp. IMCC45206]|uniref:patatin-like phospholipase family protein n=1 Tax=Rubrivirga sp. IMCC45206 TaxID=3391614 RepID=UPI00398FF2D5